MRTCTLFLVLSICFSLNCGNQNKTENRSKSSTPQFMSGTFEDDYGIQYSVSDSLFILLPNDIYHIKKWDLGQQFLIAQNDSANSYDPGKWTRIDWIELENMSPFDWAFCLSVFNAETAMEAENSATVNPEIPRTGCNDFPFSRMKQIAQPDTTSRSY